MVSPTWWTWVWASSGVGDGQGSLACCSPWVCKEWDTTKQLNWTEELLMWDLSRASGLRSFAQETCRFATVGSRKSTFGSCFWIYLQDPSLPARHCSLPFSCPSNLCTSISSGFSTSPVSLLPQPQTSQGAVSFEVISFHHLGLFPSGPFYLLWHTIGWLIGVFGWTLWPLGGGRYDCIILLVPQTCGQHWDRKEGNRTQPLKEWHNH